MPVYHSHPYLNPSDQVLTWTGFEGEQELRNLSGYDRVIVAKLEQEGLCKVREY